MPEPLKAIYNRSFFTRFAEVMHSVYPSFPSKKFLQYLFAGEWESLELKQRMRHISLVLRPLLPDRFRHAASVVVAVSAALQKRNQAEMDFPYMFLPDFIEVFGRDRPEISIPALGRITRFTSAEFAIRPFLLDDPDRVMKQMLRWARDDHRQVRRLSSEGCRPRLPWAMALPFLKKDPAPLLPILERLKADPSETVRRSVANNLNDISKDHPALVLRLAKEWSGKNETTDWIIRHGCRTLLKKGDGQALRHFGYRPGLKATVSKLQLPVSALHIGDTLSFSFEVISLEKKKASIRLEYAIEYFRASRKTATKVFQLARITAEPGQPIGFKRKQRFADLTTRKHYPGPHRLFIRLNGQHAATAKFTLLQ